jgi:hypothetical protein
MTFDKHLFLRHHEHQQLAHMKGCVADGVAHYFSIPRDAMSTQELAEALWPMKQAPGEQMTARKKMVDLLLRMAPGELSAYATKGKETGKRFMGKPVRPWVWHNAESKAEAPAPAGEPVRAALEKIHNWLVCAPLCSAEDMAQSFEEMERAASEALGYSANGSPSSGSDELPKSGT